MGTCLSPGDLVSRYRVEELLNDGAYAICYRAVDTTDPQKRSVFLKQYKSPSVRTGWYRGYVAYEEEIRFRIQQGGLVGKTCAFLDFFESRDAGQRGYYQVFEFLDRGKDLQAELEDEDFRWQQRWTFAKLMLSTLCQLHRTGIVHCDLKPENLFLVESPELSTGYRLKVIDFDHSILADREAPWKGYESYAGTPGYLSPEHLRGECPVFASDVFTASLILQELLCQEGHPYDQQNPQEYRRQALEHAAPLPHLRESTGDPSDDLVICRLLQLALSPRPEGRPAMQDLHLALLQAGKGLLTLEEAPEKATVPPAPPAPVGAPRTPMPALPDSAAAQWPPKPAWERETPQAAEGEATGRVPLRKNLRPLPTVPGLPKEPPMPPKAAPVTMPPPEPASEPAPPPEPASEPAPPPPEPSLPRGIVLSGPGGQQVVLNIETHVGKRLLSRFGEDCRYYSELQYTLYPEEGSWYVSPNGGAQNKTLLNGEVLSGRTRLKDGDVLCVGNPLRGITKLPLSVSFPG